LIDAERVQRKLTANKICSTALQQIHRHRTVNGTVKATNLIYLQFATPSLMLIFNTMLRRVFFARSLILVVASGQNSPRYKTGCREPLGQSSNRPHRSTDRVMILGGFHSRRCGLASTIFSPRLHHGPPRIKKRRPTVRRADGIGAGVGKGGFS
jgi:hypothetical protein